MSAGGERAGLALPVALAAIVVLSGVAALAIGAASAASRESAAVRDDAQERASRESIRARVQVQLARHGLAEVAAHPIAVGGSDTALSLRALTWPWFRVGVTAGGNELIAEVGRATTVVPPWCAGSAHAGVTQMAAGSFLPGPAPSCSDSARVSIAAFTTFDSTVVANLAVAATVDTIVLSGAVGPGVWRARAVVQLVAGAGVTGLLIAPNVLLDPGAALTGMAVSRDSLRVSAGSRIVADSSAARRGIQAAARLLLSGRRGFLLPP